MQRRSLRQNLHAIGARERPFVDWPSPAPAVGLIVSGNEAMGCLLAMEQRSVGQ
jgi:hypothetical protein